MSSRIDKIEIFRVPPRWLFIRVETESGIVGWGESSLEGHTEAVEGASLALRETFLGWDGDKIQDIWQHAYRSRFYRGGPVLMSALSGLDIALWDIKGKKLSVPIWQLLGGKVRDRVKVYGWVGGDSPQAVVEGAKARKEQGFTAVKMNGTGAVDWIDSPSQLDDTVTRVRDVRALGLDVGVDFHGRLHKGMAKQLAKKLEPYEPLFIEEPLLPTQPEEIADLSRMVSTPIALGERLYTRQDWRPYLERRAVDIAQPDISHCGGISELHRIASLTETYDVRRRTRTSLPVRAYRIGCVHAGGRYCTELHVPVVVIQEMSWQMHYNKGADLFTYLTDASVFAVKEGYVDILSGPGLGIEINESLVRETAERYSKEKAWRNDVWTGPDGSLREW